MASHKNFSQSVQRKHKINAGELSDSSPVKDVSIQQLNSFQRNLDKWVYFTAWSRWYPDLFLDMIHPEDGGIVLDLDQRAFLRGILRFVSVYGVYPRAYGKCSSLDSYLYSSKGMLQLSDFISNDYEYHTTDFDTINRYGETEYTYLGAYNGIKETLKISTKYGYNNECTHNHKLLVMQDNGHVDWKRADEIKIGDYLCVNRHNDIWGNEIDISYASDRAKEKISSQCPIYGFPEVNTPDFSYLIGLLIGDGSVTLKGSFKLTSADDEIAEFLSSFMKKECGYDVQHRRKYDFNINSTYLRQCLYELGLDYVTSHHKTIPKFIRQSPKECCRAFLQGLFDTDGGIEQNIVSYATTSEELSIQVQLMLLNFGIISKRVFCDRGEFNHWRVYIMGENVNLFHDKIGFRLSRKQKQLESILTPLEKINTNTNYIPHQKDNVNTFFDYIRENGEHNPKLFDKLYHVRKGNNELTYNKAEALCEEFKHFVDCEDTPYLLEVINKDYFYSPVVSIEESTAETGDINMPDTNSWICNGVVSHNTFLEVLSLFLVCMFYPNIEVAMTAQTQANAAKMLKDKYTEIIRFWPVLQDEIHGKPSFGKDTAEIRFNNGSIFNVLANNQNSKGQRRKRINIEESALLDAFTFDDALKPIVDFPRYTSGKLAIVNPEEISQRISFFTTAGFRGTDEHTRSLQLLEGMANNDGSFIFGSDWRLASWYGRGTTPEQMKERRKSMSSISFAQNYMSRWVGASENQLVDAKRLLSTRNLAEPEFEPEDGFDYVFGIDVARSSKEGNNESCVSILKAIRNANNTVREIRLVNMVMIPGTTDFGGQAIEIKRLYNIFHPKMCVVDINGLGVGLKDVLVKTQIDPNTGEDLKGWDTVVESLPSPVIGAEEVLYDLYPQSVQSKATVTFMDVVSSGKLRLLVQKDESELDIFSKDDVLKYAPYKQTDEVINEILNLKVKYNSNGSLGVEQVVAKIPKDRYTSLSYGIWWIMEFDNIPNTEDGTMADFFTAINQSSAVSGSPQYLIKKIFR